MTAFKLARPVRLSMTGSASVSGDVDVDFNARVQIWGQSNAVGRADRADISASPLSSDPGLQTYDEGTFDRVWIWTGTAYTKLQPSVFNGQTVSAGDFGPEFGLAVRWMRETTGGDLYIDKNCEGGISITEFDPVSGTWYASGETEYGQGSSWLTTNAVTIDRRAMVWIQGEQDSAQSESWYSTRLTDMIAAVRSDGILASDSLVVLSRMHPSSSTYGSGVDAAKTAYATANPSNSTTLVMPNYLSDTIHLNGRGMVQHAYDCYRAIFGGAQIDV